MGISLKKVELESFIKSFLLFFISLSSVILFLVYQTYKKDLHDLKDTLFAQMQIASLTDNHIAFKKTVIDKTDDIVQNVFYLDNKEISIYFDKKDSNNSLLKVAYPIASLDYDEGLIFKKSLEIFLKSLVVIFIISVLFSLYSLYPYKKYLKLTDEFIKDILHDFNTPLSTLRLNTAILKKKIDNKNIKRIEGSVDTIFNLQNNLKEYLEDDIQQSEKFNIKDIIHQRVDYTRSIFPNIKFETQLEDKTIYCYKDGFIRILDNILSNACKYNKKDGSVTINLNNTKILEIIDTGIGIKKPKKIFNRFYKETSRGLGIGLHIVKKLSKKMKIPLHVHSKLNHGTTFKLDLTKLILN